MNETPRQDAAPTKQLSDKLSWVTPTFDILPMERTLNFATNVQDTSPASRS